MVPPNPYNARVLTVDDLKLITNFENHWACRYDLPNELIAQNDYIWMGLFNGARLVALHRSIRWGQSLLLKGLYVAQEYRGTTAALQLALALKVQAKKQQYNGILAWVEPTKRESMIAARLRIKTKEPMVHRFEISIPDKGTALKSKHENHNFRSYNGSVNFKTNNLSIVRDLIDCNTPKNTYFWSLDQNRILLSGLPGSSKDDMLALIDHLRPIISSFNVDALEVPVRASDLTSMLILASYKCRRLSRSIVSLGHCKFTDQEHYVCETLNVESRKTNDALCNFSKAGGLFSGIKAG